MATMAPTAARPGANTAPTTPAVSGNSAVTRAPLRTRTRRTLPSWSRSFSFLNAAGPSAFTDSQQVSAIPDITNEARHAFTNPLRRDHGTPLIHYAAP